MADIIKFPGETIEKPSELIEKAQEWQKVILIGEKESGEVTWMTSEEDLQWIVFALETVKSLLIASAVLRTK